MTMTLTAMKLLFERYPGSMELKTGKLQDIDWIGYLPAIQWLYAKMPCKVLNSTIFPIASEYSHDDVVRWLVEQSPQHENDVVIAAKGGHIHQLRWLLQHAKCRTDSIGVAVGAVADRGDLETAQFLHGLSTTPYHVSGYNVARDGHVEVLEWLYENNLGEYWVAGPREAAAGGQLEVLQWLYSHEIEGLGTHVMDAAATNGHLGVVKWLHANRREGCTWKAMDGAAAGGHLEVLQWLKSNCCEGCSPGAMDGAAANGHLHVVEWLRANYSLGFTEEALDQAIRNNHLEVVKRILEHYHNGCPRECIVDAAGVGYLEMISLLHSGIGGGIWPTSIMDAAASHGHLEVLQFLHEIVKDTPAEHWMKQFEQPSGGGEVVVLGS